MFKYKHGTLDGKVLTVFKYLDRHSRMYPNNYRNFHLWDADSQGDMCVKIVKRLVSNSLPINPTTVIIYFSAVEKE